MTKPLDPQAIENFRTRLTGIAMDLFRTYGADGVTMRALAAAAGVSRTTPYSYFQNKEEILDSIRAAGFDRLTRRYEAALASQDDVDDPVGRLKRVAREYLVFAVSEPALYHLMFDRPVVIGTDTVLVVEAADRFRAVARPTVDACVEGRLIAGDADAVIAVTWATVHGLVSLYHAGHFGGADRFEALVEAAEAMVWNGLLPRDLTSPIPSKGR